MHRTLSDLPRQALQDQFMLGWGTAGQDLRALVSSFTQMISHGFPPKHSSYSVIAGVSEMIDRERIDEMQKTCRCEVCPSHTALLQNHDTVCTSDHARSSIGTRQFGRVV